MTDTAAGSKFAPAQLKQSSADRLLLQVLGEANRRLLWRAGVADLGDVAGVTSKSGAATTADAGTVRKLYHDGVRPDHMAFDSIAREKALAQQPAICCPNCHVAVGELDSARPRYEKPDGVEEAAPLHYVLHPCGCKVHPEWAAAFTKELNRRIAGSVPLPVCAFKPEELDDRTLALEERITHIMAERDEAEGQARRRLEYYLVIAVDELMRLLPGAHNRLPRIDALDPEVEAWAGTNKMRTPPAKKTSELGYPKGYVNPLAPKAATGVVNLFGPGTDQLLKTEASLLAKEEAMHVDPAVAAAGKTQLDKQRGARQIQRLGGILSRRTLAEVFNIDISAEQEELARSVAAQAKAQPVLPAGQEELVAAGMDRGIIRAAREFMDHHTSLCLQLINEQVIGQPYTDTRHAAAALVTAKRNIDQHLVHGGTVHPEVLQLLRLIVPVFLPATGMVPTRPGPATGVPLPVTAADIKEDFHAQFAPSRRRIVRKKDGS